VQAGLYICSIVITEKSLLARHALTAHLTLFSDNSKVLRPFLGVGAPERNHSIHIIVCNRSVSSLSIPP